MKKECIFCGLCKKDCDVFLALRKESVSPRGKALIIKEVELDKILYACTMCKKCVDNCPVGFNLEMRKVRADMVKEGIETPENKKMISKLREKGRPF